MYHFLLIILAFFLVINCEKLRENYNNRKFDYCNFLIFLCNILVTIYVCHLIYYNNV